MGWTKQQEEAIYAPMGQGNILVSAAAGSGKTAVLVERILNKIISGETTADRLLAVTFTEAAAAEMREKIIKRLIKEQEEGNYSEKEKKFIKSQIHLAETADIMTIDAFCNRVVQNNFHILGTDPNVGIADTAMCELMRAEAMQQLFERLYKTDDAAEKERFDRLIDAYASNRDERGLEDLINHVYKFIVSFAEPVNWLDNSANVYRLPAAEMPNAKYLEGVSRFAAEKCLSELEKIIPMLGDRQNEKEEEINAELSFLIEYAEVLKNAALSICEAEDWDGIFEVYKRYFVKKRGKNAQPCILLTEPCVSYEENSIYADELNLIRKNFIYKLGKGVTVSSEDLQNQCNGEILAEEAEDIVWVVKEFIKEYGAIKERKKVREFSDIEHMTYELFQNHEDIRNMYRDKYDEILIDEYQDTNGLQDALFGMISNNNMFMVGDLKQSIYRFRGGDPYIFKEKSSSFEKAENGDTKIVLSQNFRSRHEILDSVNDIFKCVMSSDAGDVDYTGDELIVRDEEREYYPPSEGSCKSQLYYIGVDKNSGIDKEEAEIRFTADKICQMLSSGMLVYDKDSGRMRPIRKRDIVILENSVKSNGKAVVDALAQRGIEAFTETESFFDRREIRLMLSLISVIDNARQDIPLIAVLRSPIGGFSENELVRIRLRMPNADNFISAMRVFADGRGLTIKNGLFRLVRGHISRKKGKRKRLVLVNKCRGFVNSLRRWRGYIRSKSVAQLIWSIYEETYFYDMMGAIEQGEEAQFNLRLLYERAKTYERAGYKGLFNFIRYIEQIEGRDEDLGGAKLIGENHDVVRVMTIHKSKGLEFPVVFLLGAGKDFPPSKDFPTVRLHKDLGFGLPYIYYDEHYMRDTKIKELIYDVNKSELIAERIRLAYVALTRAREKLIVTVCRSIDEGEGENEIIDFYKTVCINGRMPTETALSAKGFHSWLCPAAIESEKTWDFIFINEHDIAKQENELRQDDSESFENSSELRKAVFDILGYRYPYTRGNEIPSRTSVTQIKELTIERRNNEENKLDEVIYEPDSRRLSGTDDMAELMFSPLHVKPAFMREKGDKPANEIGTLYHIVMSQLDLSLIREKGIECIESQINRLIESNVISVEDEKYINADKIKAFYESDIGIRLLHSAEIHREEPFQINIPATEYDPSLDGIYADETVILQGIIDCFFKEGNGYVLVDYKTDNVRNNAVEIRNKYEKQLELYKKAIEKLTGEKVTESVLYLFDSGEIV